MSAPYAFVTLLTSDSYLPGALAIASALQDVHQSQPTEQKVKYETVCIVTPETLDVTTIRLLRRAFDVVIGVEVIVQPDPEGLALLGRPDLDTVLTKLHVFRLTQYSKVIFLDADVLPVRPLSQLFGLDHEFSAVPDVGWPDIFNSGVMVLSPGEDKFKELQELLKTRGSWDGGDQGVLNEWRGNNWNRLSFTYNTTPTAAYTYAPAYERFGSQISAIHFIGPNKPWNSIPYRAPGSSAAQPTNMDVESASTEAPSIPQHAYNYGSLVDRWYNVYDRHYRSQAGLSDSEFEVRKYASAWNEQNLAGSDSTGVVTGALGLEDLRRLALEGMGSLGMISTHRANEEGEYRSMPLEGRFDLMRPRTRAERKHDQLAKESSNSAQPEPTQSPTETSYTSEAAPSTPVGQIISLPSGSPVRWATLPTPGANELPSAPHARMMSLPPTPLHYVPSPYAPVSTTRETGAQTGSPQPLRQSPGGRPSSPPLLTWNPALDPPPKSTPLFSAFPTDTYFPNVWDRSRRRSGDRPPSSSVSTSSLSSETSATSTEPGPSKPEKTPHSLFSPPPAPDIPEMLLRQGHYRNVTGEEGGFPSPDRAKVKRIFPWEERPRHAPGRVFPGEDAPPPDSTIFLQSPPVVVSATPERRPAAFRSPMPSPLAGFPPTLQNNNPWDGGSGMQKYAKRLARPAPSPSPLAPAFENASKRLLDRSDTNSHDGDVEDEVDSEDDASARSRSRSSSVGTTKRVVWYRSIGVQTDVREVQDEGVQVATLVATTDLVEKKARPRVMSVSLRRHWPPSTASNALPPLMASDLMQGAGSRTPRSSALSKATNTELTSMTMRGSPSRLLSPPKLESSRASSPSASPIRPTSTTPKPGRAGTNSPPSPSSRQSPSDTSGASPVSSVGPHSPAEGQPLVQGRRGSRVWDPARGVDVFKRGSEEVLAKFLKMGSWETHG
ncbi:glycosyltransferase family 8 protein [Hydnomerulius pinastri MD-312]|nr:glycosyltransferase family 8 protein [Hydnomerulius pinastri MD-312]